MNRQEVLTDSFGRKHTYLRISLTERCNLRCTYCMPAEGILLSPKSSLMSADEVVAIATQFVNFGVTKIRLTGGEPLVRKDAGEILERLADLPVEISITTNGVNVDRYMDDFKRLNIRSINVSLDTLDKEKFHQITRRNYFDRIYENIFKLVEDGMTVKLNCVLIKDFNESEIVDFVELTQDRALQVRFIEFMPFEGNRWKMDKLVSYKEVIDRLGGHYAAEDIIRLKDRPNDTSKNYKIDGYEGGFAVISTVTNPFCDSCNRIRLTANGKIKNCLFSASESDLLEVYRSGKPIAPVVEKVMKAKFKMRGGMDTIEKFSDPKLFEQNRSMIAIGG